MTDWVNARLHTLNAFLPESLQDRLIVELGLAVLVTAFFLLLYKLVLSASRRMVERVRRLKGIRIRALKLQKQDLLTEEQGARILGGAVHWAARLALALLVYLNVEAVFRLIPATQGIAEQLFQWLRLASSSVLGAIASYIPKLFTLIVVIFAAKWIIHFVNLIFEGIAEGRISIHGFYPEWARPTFGLVRLLLIALTLVVAFPYLPGSGSKAFQGVSIFVGVLFSLSSSGVVSNLVSGMALTYTRAFQVGDFVGILSTVGTVVEKTALVTRIRTVKNEIVSIPNASVMASHVVNYSVQADGRGVLLHTEVTIGYDVPWRTVHEVLVKAALATGNLEEDPPPFVRQARLDDFYVAYELNAFTRSPAAMYTTLGELHQNMQDGLHEAGIEIASPHLSALRDGNTINVPEEHRAADYSPGGLRIQDLILPNRDRQGTEG